MIQLCKQQQQQNKGMSQDVKLEAGGIVATLYP
jgi:hypothetical protein